MKNYSVTFEARKSGAIGIFYPLTRTVAAPDAETATRYAMRTLHAESYETRFPIRTKQVTTPSEEENL